MQRAELRLSPSNVLVWIAFVGIAAGASAAHAAADPIVGAKKSKVYHTHPKDCPSAQHIDAANIVRWATEAEAIKEGRRLCKKCAKLTEQEQNKKDKSSKSPDAGRLPKKSKPSAETEKDESDDEAAPPTLLVEARVKKALHGGTLQMENGDKVRLAGILVPQVGQPLADETVRLIQKQLKGRKIQLAPIADADAKARRDALGRMIAYVSLGSGDSDLGGELIAEGLAAVDRSTEFDRLDDYLKREDDAAWAGRGIWKKLDGPDGELTVVTGKHTHEYHRPDCPHVMHLTEPATITVNEAKGRRLCPCEYYQTKENGKKE